MRVLSSLWENREEEREEAIVYFTIFIFNSVVSMLVTRDGDLNRSRRDPHRELRRIRRRKAKDLLWYSSYEFRESVCARRNNAG